MTRRSRQKVHVSGPITSKEGKTYFEIRWREPGTGCRRQYKERVYVETREAARSAVEGRIQECLDPQAAAAKGTFEDFIDRKWTARLKEKRVKRATIYSYQSMLKNYAIPVIGKNTDGQHPTCAY